MKTSSKWVTLLLVLMILHVPVYSQHQHNPVAGTIDGATHPELIPDIAAYRLFLLAVASDQNSSSVSQDARQRAFVKMSGLTDQDTNAALSIINDFKSKYSGLIEQYNAAVQNPDAPEASASGRKAFLAKRDALVQATRSSLSIKLSLQGAQSLDNYIRAEKKHMKVAQEEQ